MHPALARFISGEPRQVMIGGATGQMRDGMTTVDVYVTRAGAPEFSLHNGLSGPATTVFHRLVDLIRTGEVTGTWDGASVDAEVPGAVVRQLLVGVGDDADSYQPIDEQALLANLVDDDLYKIEAIEF
jgi:hypothetical protein